MAEITLLRHGQASFGAANYDQLSELGYQQAEWLGEHLRALEKSYDKVIIGSMARHRQTADSLYQGLNTSIEFTTDPGLNEYIFQGLLTPLKESHSHLWVDTGNAKRDYNDNLKNALIYWMNGEIETDGLDSWESFKERVIGAFETARSSAAKRILLVSSGGPIAVILAHVLGLNHASLRELNMQIRNTSTHRILYNRTNMALDSYNDVAHLQHPLRQHAITFS